MLNSQTVGEMKSEQRTTQKNVCIQKARAAVQRLGQWLGVAFRAVGGGSRKALLRQGVVSWASWDVKGRGRVGGRSWAQWEVGTFKELGTGSGVTQGEVESLGRDKITLWFFHHIKDLGFHTKRNPTKILHFNDLICFIPNHHIKNILDSVRVEGERAVWRCLAESGGMT